MRRKLRKSLSWLLTVSMIFSLVFGAIPTASAVDDETEINLGEIGSIDYIPGDLETTVTVYLNYVEVTTKTINVFDSNLAWEPQENFVLQLNPGYVFDSVKATDNFRFDSTTTGMVITYPSPYTHLDFSLPELGKNGNHTIEIYLFNFESEDGITINFDGYVDNVLVSDVLGADACPSLDVSYTYKGETYQYVWTDIDGTREMLVPLGTKIYVEANIDYSQYSFEKWSTAVNCPLYTINQDDEETRTGTESSSAYMAIEPTSTSASGRTIWLYMESEPTTFIVSYEANTGSGEMQPQTFQNNSVTILENSFIAPTGKVFDSWNTKADGTGEKYTPGETYGDGVNEKWNLTLYAQWKDDVTTPPDEGYVITVFTKELVDDPKNVPTGLNPEDYTFPNDKDVVTVPVNAEVTLLYKLTVTGDVGASYEISDDGATLVTGDGWEGTITGTTGETGTAVIYVTKTFNVNNIDPVDSTLTNSATIEAGEDTTLEGDDGSDTEETLAEEGAPLPPTEEELDDLFGDGTAGAVTIHCTTAETSINHTEVTYGLLDGYTMTETLGDGTTESPWYVTVTVTPDAYVDAYITTYGKHELNPEQPESYKITLTWTKDTGWTVASEVPVVYTVTCDDEHWTNSTEFHIMYLDDIKQAVADRMKIENVDEIQIYLIGVTGTVQKGQSSSGTSDETTGGAYKELAQPNKGYNVGSGTINGYLDDYFAWKVLNAAPIIRDDTVTSITIDYKYNGEWGEVTVPCTDFEKVVKLEEKSITQIYLDTSSDEPAEPGDEKPEKPTEDEITDPEGILENAIQLDGSTDGHESKAYSIAKNEGDVVSYEIGEVEGSADTGYTCVIEV